MTQFKTRNFTFFAPRTVILYKKVDDNDGYKAEITTTFKKI